MSDQDKDAVLEEFIEAYKAAKGKKPKIEASNGWYSVNGEKNQRLAQLEEWTKELKKESKKSQSSTKSSAKPSAKKSPAKTSETKTASTKKSADKKPASKKSSTKKQPAKKPAAKKSTSATKKNSDSGLTPAQVWRDKLAAEPGFSRLPRGLK